MPMGDAIKNYAVFRDSEGTSEETLQRIGSRKPNPAGFYDMAGNAAEMVQDGFQFSLGGRLHGSTGGFIRKGGGFLSTQDEVMPGRREEVAPFLKDGPFPASTPPAAQGPRNWPRNGRRPGSSCPPN